MRSKEVSRSLGLMNSAATSAMGRPSAAAGCMFQSSVSGVITTAAKRHCTSRRAARPWARESDEGGLLAGAGAGAGGALLDDFQVLAGFERFTVDLVKRWDLRVPFQQGCRRAAQLDRTGIQLPDRI